MKLSYQWLKEILPGLKVAPNNLAEILNMHVAQVEEIKELSKELNKVIVAEIVEIKPHPNADRLQIAKVKTKINNRLSIINVVCGALNIKVGQKVPLALAGAKLAKGIEIKESIIRGVKSEGMLCAEDELGIGPDHEGIYILPSEAKIGEPINKILGLDDVIFEIENKSITHRPDLFSHIGFSREIGAILNLRSKIFNFIKQIRNPKFKTKKSVDLKIKVEDFRFCSRYMAVVIDDIKIKPSPLWLQNRLRNLGIRPINNIVDITNYVMMEIGQPLHAFDFDKLEIGGQESKEIIIRKAKSGEKLLALDGKEYELSNNDLVIADNKKPIALAGIIGGEKSSITNQTKTIIIESANFDSVTIRRTSWRLGLRTEAALRFEKGLPLNFPEIGIHRAIELIQKLAGGKIISKIYDERCPVVTAKLINPKRILINLERINKIIGQEIGKKEVISILKSLGFEIKEIDLIKTLIKLAKEQVGKPYKFGASTLLEAPNVFDCSSLTRWLYRQIGVELPRMSIEQIEIGEKIEIKNLKPGDLVFSKGDSHSYYNEKHPDGVGHVGIYIGQGKVIHAKGKKKRVVKTSLKEFTLKKSWRGARRIIQIKRGLVVKVPIFRPDITLEEDIIEEIIRIYGTEKIKPRPIIAELKPVPYEPEFILEREIRNILVSFGFDEVYNYSFESRIDIDKTGGASNTLNKLTLPQFEPEYLRLANPLNPEQRYLRVSLLSGLIKNTEKNINYFDEFRIFEIGRIFKKSKNNIEQNIDKNKNTNAILNNNQYESSFIVEQPKHLAGLICSTEKDIYFLTKGIIEVIFKKISLDHKVKFLNNSNFSSNLFLYFYQPTTATKIVIDNQEVGIFGLLRPELIDIKIKREIGIFEIDLERLSKFSLGLKKYQLIPSYPPVKRDLAFLINKKITWQEIFETIKNIHPLIKEIDLFDVFEDKKFGERRNLAFHIIYQSNDRTLKTEEVEKIEAQIIKILKEKFNAELRSF